MKKKTGSLKRGPVFFYVRESRLRQEKLLSNIELSFVSLKIRFLFFLFLPLFLRAQPTREISFSAFLEKIRQHPGDTVKLSQMVVKPDSTYRMLASANPLPDSLTSDTLHIRKWLVLEEVELPAHLSGIRFHRPLIIVRPRNLLQIMKHCHFEEGLLFFGKEPSESQFLTRFCVFERPVNLGNLENFRSIDCRYESSIRFRGQIGSIKFARTLHQLRNKPRPDEGLPFLIQAREISPEKPLMMEIFHSRFLATAGDRGIDFFYNRFDYLNFQSCTFEVPLLFYLARFDRMVMENCTVSAPIDFREASFSPNSTNLAFFQIAGKIGVKDTFHSAYEEGEVLYQARLTKDFEQKGNYTELMAVYSRLLGLYRFRGDQESYNACYVEMKDIASRKSAYDYHKAPELESLFEWRLSQFLKTFCDYGTNPVKSLVFSFYVILCFAGIYFLFPSEEDNLSKGRFSQLLGQAIGSFLPQEKRMEEMDLPIRQELEKLQLLRQQLKEARKQTPAALIWIARPFFAWLSVYYQLMDSFYHRTRWWRSASSTSGLGSGFRVSLFVLGFFIWGLIIRLLNALSLSLNVFVTLGYGEISATGGMRYLAVLEGLLGWFLLSIFSVSLIGQVLQ